MVTGSALWVEYSTITVLLLRSLPQQRATRRAYRWKSVGGGEEEDDEDEEAGRESTTGDTRAVVGRAAVANARVPTRFMVDER